MSYNVKTLDVFERQAKRLLKKYPSLANELPSLILSLKENPEQGQSIGNHCFKIRLAIASKGKGKSGGARVITYVVVAAKNVYLISIYDKSEKASLSGKELRALLKSIPLMG